MHHPDVRELDESVSGCLGMWFSLAMYPANMPIDSSLLTFAKHGSALQVRCCIVFPISLFS